METGLYFARFVQHDLNEYSRLLTSYAQLINENDDVKRLKILATDLKESSVLVGPEKSDDE